MSNGNLLVILLCFIFLTACSADSADAGSENSERSKIETNEPQSENQTENSFSQNFQSEISAEIRDNDLQANSSTSQPKTVRDFFMLLPEKYFTLEGCERAKDKDCRKAKINYLKTFAEIEDTKNGYLKGGCDGGQSCLEMALFKRPDGTYIIGLSTFAEMMNDYYFLEYKNGNWANISAEIVPQFSKKNMYELPRYGTTVKVFAKKIIEETKDYEISDKGEKLYDLEWKDGKFNVKK